MNRIVVLLILLFPVSVSSFNIFKPDTALLVNTIYESWSDGKWLIDGKENNCYDDQKRLSFSNYSTLVGGNRLIGYICNYGFDSTKIEQIHFDNSGLTGTWEFQLRDSIYIHPESDTFITYYKNDTTCEYNSRSISNYDATGNLIEKCDMVYYNNGWNNAYRHVYQYDDKGKMISELSQNWDINSLSWIASIHKVLSYNTNGRLKCVLDSMPGASSAWDLLWKTSYRYYYQSCYLIIEAYTQEWSNGSFRDYSIDYDTLDVNGKKIGTLRYSAKYGPPMRPIVRISYSYDSFGNLIEETVLTNPDNAGWINHNRNRYEYAYYFSSNSMKLQRERRSLSDHHTISNIWNTIRFWKLTDPNASVLYEILNIKGQKIFSGNLESVNQFRTIADEMSENIQPIILQLKDSEGKIVYRNIFGK